MQCDLKIQVIFIMDFHKIILKCMSKCKEQSISTTPLKNNECEDLVSQKPRNILKLLELITNETGKKDIKETNGTK